MDGPNAGSSLAVRTWTLDTVIGERLVLNSDWVVDLNGGLRLTDFQELQIDNEFANGNGEFTSDHSWVIGGIVGCEASRSLCHGFSLDTGVNLAVIHGDHRLQYNRNGDTPVDRRFQDETYLQSEVFAVLKYSRLLGRSGIMFAKAGWQWINYQNATSSYVGRSPANSEMRTNPGADAGFGGCMISVSFAR